MEKEKSNRFYNSFIFKIINSFAGSKKDLALFQIINLTLGILYSFKIWDQVAILIIFGMLFPALYTIILYRLFKLKNLHSEEVKVFKFAKSDFGNILLLVIDIIILLILGILIIIGILDFIIIRLLIVVILPLLYLLIIHTLINTEEFKEKEK